MQDGENDEAAEAAEEAEWELATAETLRGKGDLDSARTWYRRAAEHLMDAGLDDRALEIAKLLASLAPTLGPRETPRVIVQLDAPGPDTPVPPAPETSAPESLPPEALAPDSLAPESIVPESIVPESIVPDAPAPPPPPTPTPPVSATPEPLAVAAVAIPSAPRVPQGVGAVPEATLPLVSAGSGVVASTRPTARGLAAPPPRPSSGFVVPMPTPLGGHPAAPGPLVPSKPPSAPSAPSARASVRPLSQPPRASLTWRPERELASEQLAARLLVLPLFQEVDPEARRRYAREASLLTFSVGEVMVPAPPPGERSDESALLVVVEGTAVTAVPGDDVPVALLGPGDFTGELGALHGGIPVAETVARTEVKAVAFAPSLVRAMAREQESMRRALDEVAWERAFAALGRGARLLERLSRADRVQAFAAFEPLQLEEGALLLSEGSAPEALWLLAAGEVEVYGGALEGIWRARAGEALGLCALLDATVAGVTARAVRTVLAARLPSARVARLLRDHPALHDARDDLGVVC